MATYNEIIDLINLNLASGTEIPAVKHREVEIALLNFIQSNLPQSGDIKVIKADATYISNNFERDGLGKNLRAGWAMCNGNYGPDLQGRVPIHYSRNFPLGTVGGSKDAVVVEHSHTYTQYALDQEVSSNGNGVRALNKNDSQSGKFITSTTGVSGTNKNMQPYLATVYIIKL